jgi:hypothetical protein
MFHIICICHLILIQKILVQLLFDVILTSNLRLMFYISHLSNITTCLSLGNKASTNFVIINWKFLYANWTTSTSFVHYSLKGHPKPLLYLRNLLHINTNLGFLIIQFHRERFSMRKQIHHTWWYTSIYKGCCPIPLFRLFIRESFCKTTASVTLTLLAQKKVTSYENVFLPWVEFCHNLNTRYNHTIKNPVKELPLDIN